MERSNAWEQLVGRPIDSYWVLESTQDGEVRVAAEVAVWAGGVLCLCDVVTEPEHVRETVAGVLAGIDDLSPDAFAADGAVAEEDTAPPFVVNADKLTEDTLTAIFQGAVSEQLARSLVPIEPV
jgi:hypothetical protein